MNGSLSGNNNDYLSQRFQRHKSHECKHHQFCENTVPSTPRDSETDNPLPKRKIKDSKGNSINMKNLNVNPLHSDQRLVVTNRGLDDWLAKNFGLSLDNIPQIKPYHVPITGATTTKSTASRSKRANNYNNNKPVNPLDSLENSPTNKGKKIKNMLSQRKNQPSINESFTQIQPIVYNINEKVKSEFIEQEFKQISKDFKSQINDSFNYYQNQTKDSSNFNIKSGQSTLHDRAKSPIVFSSQLTLQKRALIQRLVGKLDGVVSRDELEESIVIHQSFEKSFKDKSQLNIKNQNDASRLSINDYPTLMNNRTLSFGGTVTNQKRLFTSQNQRLGNMKINLNNSSGSVFVKDDQQQKKEEIKIENPYQSNLLYRDSQLLTKIKNKFNLSGDVIVDQNGSSRDISRISSQRASRTNIRSLGGLRGSNHINRIKEMREKAFSDFQETIRQSSAFNHYIKDKIMSKDQQVESQSMYGGSDLRSGALDDIPVDNSSQEDDEVDYDIQRELAPLDYKQTSEQSNRMQTDFNKTNQISSASQDRAKVFRGKFSILIQLLDSDFWYHKGITTGQKNQMQTAVECYKQALKLIKPDWSDAYYGACLSSFKLTQYDKALGFIDQAIDKLSDMKQQQKNAYVYMKAVCLKKLRRYQDCLDTYKELHDIIMRTENQEIVKYVFGIILLPFQNDRRLTTDYVENFENLMDFYQPRNTITDPICLYFVDGDGWKTDKVDLVVTKIKDRSFFKRFNRLQIKSFLKHMSVKKYKTDEIIFIEDAVAVILEGVVHLKSHSENILPPKLLAKFEQGDILGYEKSDNGLSRKVETWGIVKHPTEVAFFHPQQFDVKFYFFGLLSDQTIYMLAYEFVKVKKFQPGEMIMKQSKRSILNFFYKEFFENKMTSLQIAMNEQKDRIMSQDDDQKVSGFQIMMQQLNVKINQAQNDRDKYRDPKGYQQKMNELAQEKERKKLQDEEEDIISQEEPRHNNEEVAEFKTPEHVKNERKELNLLKTTVDNVGEYSHLINDIKELETDGVYVIDTGKCLIVNPYDNYQISTIQRGDFFGESHELKVPVKIRIFYQTFIQSINYFGDIIADKKEVTCLFISTKNFLRIPIYELEKIREMCSKKLQSLQYTASKKYGISMEELSKY
ncbi:tpr repeat protein [Stylonychia lemnae]|uniref:Tpr repeat protein n=1 Tax=Stylonychia lemnae TaxID=5949 RepID=A0A078A4B3_STYLE|nr:tpr repeat protein [Stylonychia lemnae]|eukprot:CDW75604.1 tpr repeat protein [Stylonychia lemnae]